MRWEYGALAVLGLGTIAVLAYDHYHQPLSGVSLLQGDGSGGTLLNTDATPLNNSTDTPVDPHPARSGSTVIQGPTFRTASQVIDTSVQQGYAIDAALLAAQAANQVSRAALHAAGDTNFGQSMGSGVASGIRANPLQYTSMPLRNRRLGG